MPGFTYKEAYYEADKKVLEVNILPEKHCNFDCIFCPIGRSTHKGDTPLNFDASEDALSVLAHKIDVITPDLVFINSMGEALVHDEVKEVIALIQSKNVAVRLLTNGYLLGTQLYVDIANSCEEVIGEIKVITEEAFQKVQRPMEGYTLEAYIDNMATFSKQYDGVFILEVTIIKGYNDDDQSIENMKAIIKRIAPTRIIVARIEDAPFDKKLGLSDERFDAIAERLNATFSGRE